MAQVHEDFFKITTDQLLLISIQALNDTVACCISV